MGADPISAGISAGTSLIGGIAGGEAARKERSRADRAYRDALAAFSNVRVPTVEEQELLLQRPELAGQYASMLEQSPEQLATDMAGLSTDPRLAQAQMEALQNLSQVGEEGLTAVDRAKFDQLQRSTAQQQQAQQNAILQNMAQRGVGGSGMELAARLQSSQSGADRAQQEALGLAAQQQEARLQALAQAGALGGQIRGQEFGEKSDIARAKDAMAQFNQQNTLNTRRSNIEEQRRAQAANLAERQRIADEQAAISRQEETANKGLIQQQFANQMDRASGMGAASAARGKQLSGGAEGVGQAYQQIGTGVGSVFGSLLGKPATPTQAAPTAQIQPARPTAMPTAQDITDALQFRKR